jgi:succinate dehydrogenase / fumarate reductase cytochrome b subunit
MSIDRGRAWTWPLNYKGQSGQWAQLLHRITGLGVILFLLLHIFDTAVLGWGPEAYNALVNLWHQPIFRLGQVALMACLLYHAINGLRVIAIDFWDWGSLYQRQMFWATVILFVVLFVPAAYLMMVPIFQ